MSDSSKKSKADKNSKAGQNASDNNRLEKAVQDLLVIAKDEFSDRASSLVEDTTAKLKRELKVRREREEAIQEEVEAQLDEAFEEDYEERPVSRAQQRKITRRAKRRAKRKIRRMRSGGLMRDTRHQKIAGVCAGIAKYKGIDTWMVRCAAVTGMVFIPQVTFPAYIVAWIVLSKESRFERTDEVEENVAPRPSSKRKAAREKFRKKEAEAVKISSIEKSPKYRLRNVQEDLNQAELRLRRMESHVTSGHYELQKELHRIDN